MNPFLTVAEPVRRALDSAQPIVALETAVVTHGLPAPHNVEIVQAMEAAIRAQGAVPATCLAAGGCLLIGADDTDVAALAADAERQKASVRDLGRVLATRAHAGLTVSATLFAASAAGISVFATGGIGGVHRGVTESGDISSDLTQLRRSPVITVCSGAKSVLDIPRTLEFLETEGVPVVGFGIDTFPAFYLTSSHAQIPSVASAAQVASLARAQWGLGYDAGVVVGNPIPAHAAIPPELWNTWMDQAMKDARAAHVSGPAVTPYLLTRVAEHSDGRTIRANLALLEHNASVAGAIAAALSA